MIIFSQGNTPHNRLGNSITWYKDVYPIMSDNNIKFYFPWAREKQVDYLGDKSVWVKNFVKAQMLFEKAFRKPLNAKIIADESRMIEHHYEKNNKLKAFEWDCIVHECPFREILYITGNVDLTDQILLSRIKNSKLTICHEPFNFNFSNIVYTSQFVEKSYSTIMPCTQILNLCKRNLGRELKGSTKRIGIHIRGGDYKDWEDGKYYYEDSFWTQLASSLISKNKGAPIYAFVYGISKDLINKLKSLKVILHENESPDVDFVKMMLMDEIWGPESTFSVVAADIASNCLKRHVKIHTLPLSNSINLQNFILNI